jgi:AcrR family transcriptional regulator
MTLAGGAERPMSDTPRLRIPVPERVRRNQAERAAETRGKIIEAVVATIDEIGFQKTTASEITRRAGVTWGAVQHHFGDKDGIFAAVLEDSFDRFARRIADLPEDETSIEKRVSFFLDHAWEHFASPHYRSTFEILLNAAGDDRESEPVWQSEMSRAWNRVWMRLFGEAPLSRSRSRTLQHYTISVLSGLAAMKMIEGPAARFREDELVLLRDTLIRELGGEPGRDGEDSAPWPE